MRAPAALAVVVALALVPPLAQHFGAPYYLDLFTRVMIFAIAAVSLDLILGFGGLGAFNQASYLGVGAYAVGILDSYGLQDGMLQFAVAIGASALVALGVGAVALRTSGFAFIMITLAFGQMLYFFGIGLTGFGGDDGLIITGHSDFGPWLDLGDGPTLYYTVLGVLALCLAIMLRIVNSRFGMALQGARMNERRMLAIGFPARRYRLAAFMMSGALCGAAGALLANQTLFVSPVIMHWTRSGEILMMVLVGGSGTLAGPVLGAAVMLGLEDLLSAWTTHWQMVLGPILVAIVMLAPRGLLGRSRAGALRPPWLRGLRPVRQ